MNELNYASLSASKKLVENGIVLETDGGWWMDMTHQYHLVLRDDYADTIPAPCFTEVWRELPEQCDHECLKVSKDEGRTFCGYGEYADRWENTNPTDALIDLLIWLKWEGK